MICFPSLDWQTTQNFKALSHCAMFRATCLATPLRQKSHEILHIYLTLIRLLSRCVVYCGGEYCVGGQLVCDIFSLFRRDKLQKPLRKAEHGSTFCNDFKQLSALLRSHTSPLPSVNASAMFRATCLAMRCETSCTKNCTV